MKDDNFYGVWNKIMEYFGTPCVIFIFLSWYTSTMGNNIIIIAALFTIAIIIPSETYQNAIIEAIIGSLILMAIRPFFLNGNFSWFNNQTACAGVVSFGIVKLFLHFYQSKNK